MKHLNHKQIKAAFDKFVKDDVLIHPDDDAADVIFDKGFVTDKERKEINETMDLLHASCGALKLDVYDEAMQSHVRHHGSNSCFYPEHDETLQQIKEIQ